MLQPSQTIDRQELKSTIIRKLATIGISEHEIYELFKSPPIKVQAKKTLNKTISMVGGGEVTFRPFFIKPQNFIHVTVFDKGRAPVTILAVVNDTTAKKIKAAKHGTEEVEEFISVAVLREECNHFPFSTMGFVAPIYISSEGKAVVEINDFEWEDENDRIFIHE